MPLLDSRDMDASHSLTQFPIGPRRFLDHPLPPSPQQRDAIRSLNASRKSSVKSSQASRHKKIFDRLEFLRCIWVEYSRRADLDCPSENDIPALLPLVHSNNDDISAWLRYDEQHQQEVDPSHLENLRFSTASSDSNYRSSGLSSREFTRTSSFDPTISRSSVQSFDLPQSYLKHENHLSTDDQISSDSILTQLQTEFAKTPEHSLGALPWSGKAGDKKYRCSTGQHLPKARSNTVEAFKRHELEHVDRFYCVSKDTHLNSKEGQFINRQGLNFCGKRNPNQPHHTKHNFSTCLARDEPLLFTRKDVFVGHLKKDHNVDSDSIRRLVSSRPWYFPRPVSVLTCGLCVGILFDSKEKQVDHFLLFHLSLGQSMEDWDENRMMRNLLRHPLINPCWNACLASKPTVVERALSWPKDIARDLPLELDFSSITAENFASSAFKLSFTDNSNISEDDTRTPIQMPIEGRMESLTSLNQGLQQFTATPLHMVNLQSESIASFHDSPSTGDSQSYSDDARIDQTAMGQSINSHGNLTPSEFFQLRQPDSVQSFQPYTSLPGTNTAYHNMETPDAPPNTISPSQLSTTTNPNPKFYDSNNFMRRRQNILPQAHAQSQQRSSEYPTSFGKTIPQDPGNLAPTSAQVRRKLSTNRAEADGSEWYPR